MPSYAGLTRPAAAPTGRLSGYSDSAQRNAAEIQTGYTSPLAQLGGSALFGASTLVDNTLSSLRITDPGDFNLGTGAALRAVGMPGLATLQQKTTEGAEVASGLYGVVLIDMLAGKLLKPAGKFIQILSKAPVGRRIAALDAQYANALKTVESVDLAVASMGARGSQQYTQMATVLTQSWDKTAKSFVAAEKTLSHNAARGMVVKAGALKGVRHAVLSEGLLALTMNQNGFLFQDDMATNMMFALGGVGLGAGIEALHAGYRVRQIANSDLVKRAFSTALDPIGLEQARMQRLGFDPKDLPGMFTGGVYSDKATALALEAHTITKTPDAALAPDATLRSSRNALATQKIAQAHDEVQKITLKGISTDGQTRFSLNSPEYGAHLKSALYQDPAVLNGAEMLGAIPRDKTVLDVVDSHKARVKQLKAETRRKLKDSKLSAAEKDDARAYLQRLDFEDKLVPMALVDNELMPVPEAQIFSEFVEPKIIQSKPGFWEVEAETGMGKLSLDDSLIPHFPSGKSMETADVYDVMRMYRLGQRAVSKLKNSVEPLILPDNATWFQLDLAEEILQQSGGKVQVVFPKHLTRETAQIESFAFKADALNRAIGGAGGLKNIAEEKLAALRLRLNLPKLTAHTRATMDGVLSPAELMAMSLSREGSKPIDKAFVGLRLPEVKQLVADMQEVATGVRRAPDLSKDLRGNSFRFGLDANGNVNAPVLVYKRRVATPADWSTDTLVERLAISKFHTASVLTGDARAPLSQELGRALLQSPDFQLASNTTGLMDIQLQGSVFGSQPQSAFGAGTRALKTTEHLARDTPEILAGARLNDLQDRITRARMKDTVNKAFGPKLAVLQNPRNAPSRMTLNNFHSFRSGWDLKTGAISNGDGFHSFELASTDSNRARWKSQYGTDMPERAKLVDSRGREVVLDDLGLEIQMGFDSVMESLRLEKNTLLRSQGRPEIASKSWYVPPPDTKGKRIGFVLGPDNKPVPGMTVVETTQQGFDNARSAIEQRISDELGVGYMFVDQTQVANFADLWDKVAMDFISPTRTAVQPNQKGSGRLIGQDISVTAFDDSMVSLRDQYLQHGQDILQLLMKDSIQSAQARSAISGVTAQNQVARSGQTNRRNVHDFYLDALTGSSKLTGEKSVVGPLYLGVEKRIDNTLEEATMLIRKLKGSAPPQAADVTRAVGAWLRRANPFMDNELGGGEFDVLSRALGKYTPFADSAELAARRYNADVPITVQKIFGELNRFTAAMALRVMETVHPLMNLAGMVNAMPSVIRNLNRLKGETDEAWAARLGHSTQLLGGGPKQVRVLDMSKVATNALKNAWSRKRHADYDFMVERGYLSQEVAEFFKQYGAIDSKGKWEVFMYGDPTQKGFKSKGLTGWLGILSDRSEDFTRAWGHMAGLELAEHMGLKGIEARNVFAHDIANKMIANYNPANRPEALQGAMGAPVGLFQSFIINYYQRLFRYAETKDLRSLGVQLATQAGLFGTGSLPGWNQLTSMTLAVSDGETDIDGAHWQRFGGPAGDILAGGVLSNLPRLFGLPGVDFFSRGDTNVRVPGIGGNSVPAWGMLEKGWTGVAEIWDMVTSKYSEASMAQLTEIASNMSINRPLGGIMEWIGGGIDTDSYGQAVVESQNLAETVYRALGVRSMRQSKEIEAFYADKSAQETESADMSILRRNARAAMRAGDEGRLTTLFTDYVEAGGDPRQYRRWQKENYEAATTPKSERKLESLLNDPTGGDERLNYYLDRGVGITEDEQLGATNRIYYATDPEQDPLAPNTRPDEYPGQFTFDEPNQNRPYGR